MAIDLNDLWGEEGAPTSESNEPTPQPDPEPAADVVEDDDSEEEEGSDDEGEETQSPSPVQLLIKAGILTEDPGDVDEDTLTELIEEEQQAIIDETVNATFKSWAESLPEQVFNLVKYTFNGGSADDFLKAVNEVPLGAFDTSTETGQEIFLRYFYKSVEGMDEDELETKIEWLIEKGKLGDTATKSYQKLAKERDSKIEKMATQKAQEAKTAKERQLREQEQLQAKIAKVAKIGDYELPAGEKKILQRYITQPVTDGSVTYKSGLIADLQTVFDDPEKLLLLAKLVKGKFDPSFLTKSAETKVTRKIKEKLNNKPTPKEGDGTIWD